MGEGNDDELLLALLGRDCCAEWDGVGWLVTLPDGATVLPVAAAARRLRVWGGNVTTMATAAGRTRLSRKG
jgi:hypothetical protein